MVKDEAEPTTTTTTTSNGNDIENDKKKDVTTDHPEFVIASLKAEHQANLLQLTREIERLREENSSLKQQQHERKERRPLIVSQATRLVWGAENFIEGKTSEMVGLYDSYRDWYRGISESMVNEVSYTCSKYLFVRSEFGIHHERIFFISKSGKNFIKGKDMVVIDALNDGWGHNQIASIMVLHPANPDKSLEVEYSCKGDDFHQWSARDVAPECYGPNKSLLICCMLNR